MEGLQFFMLSASSVDELRARAASYADGDDVGNGQWRVVVLVVVVDEEFSWLDRLHAWGRGEEERSNPYVFSNVNETSQGPVDPRVAWMFGGAGTQTEVECPDIVADDVAVVRAADAANELQRLHLGIFRVHVMIVSLLRLLGLRMDAVVGHSIGECSAFYAASSRSMSVEEARVLEITMANAHQRALGKGYMNVIWHQCESSDLIANPDDGEIVVGATPGIGLTVLSGSNEAMGKNEEMLRRRDFRFIRPTDLGGSVPFHCAPIFEPFKDEIVASFGASVGAGRAGGLRVPWYGSSVGGRVDAECVGPLFWYESIAGPAQSLQCVKAAILDGIQMFIEINPKPLYCKTALDCGARLAIGPIDQGIADMKIRCAQCVAQLLAIHGEHVLVDSHRSLLLKHPSI